MLWTKNPCSGKPLSLGQFSYFVVPPQNWLLEFSSVFSWVGLIHYSLWRTRVNFLYS